MLLVMDMPSPPSVLDSQPLLMLLDRSTQMLSPTSMTPLARDPQLLRSMSMTLPVRLPQLLSPTFTMPLARFTQLLSHTFTLSPLLPSQPSLTQLPLLPQPSATLETTAMLPLPLPLLMAMLPPQPLLMAMPLPQLLLLPSTPSPPQ